MSIISSSSLCIVEGEAFAGDACVDEVVDRTEERVGAAVVFEGATGFAARRAASKASKARCDGVKADEAGQALLAVVLLLLLLLLVAVVVVEMDDGGGKGEKGDLVVGGSEVRSALSESDLEFGARCKLVDEWSKGRWREVTSCWRCVFCHR